MVNVKHRVFPLVHEKPLARSAAASKLATRRIPTAHLGQPSTTTKFYDAIPEHPQPSINASITVEGAITPTCGTEASEGSNPVGSPRPARIVPSGGKVTCLSSSVRCALLPPAEPLCTVGPDGGIGLQSGLPARPQVFTPPPEPLEHPACITQGLGSNSDYASTVDYSNSKPQPGQAPAIIGQIDMTEINKSYKFDDNAELKTGSFGTVRPGIRIKDGLRIMMKLMRKSQLHSDYRKEIELHRRVAGESVCPPPLHVVQLVDVFDHDPEVVAIITVDGGEPLIPRGTISKYTGDEETCRRLVAQGLIGVGESHNARVIHQDLKADNLVVNSRGHVRVCDYGQAELEGQPMGPGGAPYLRAPELNQEGAVASRAADIYAMGVTFLRLYAGTAEPILSKVRKTISAGGWEALNGMLAKDPRDRWDLKTALDKYFAPKVQGSRDSSVAAGMKRRFQNSDVDSSPRKRQKE